MEQNNFCSPAHKMAFRRKYVFSTKPKGFAFNTELDDSFHPVPKPGKKGGGK